MTKQQMRLFFKLIRAAFSSEWETLDDVNNAYRMGYKIGSLKSKKSRERFIPQEYLGGYWFMFTELLRRPANFTVYFLDAPSNAYERDALYAASKMDGCFLAIPAGEKIIFGFGDFTLADLGLELRTTELHFPNGEIMVESKLEKRAKNLFRLTRINAHSIEAFEAGVVSRPHGWNIVPIRKMPSLDGWGVVSERLFQYALYKANWGETFRPAAYSVIKERIEKSAPVVNLRTLGQLHYAPVNDDLRDYFEVSNFDPGLVIPPEEICGDLLTLIIEGMLKGNFARAELPRGYDFLVPLDQLKPEIVATRPGAIMICDPQSPKGAREDQQQTITNRFLTASVPEARETLKESKLEFLDNIANARKEIVIGQLTKDDFNTPYSFEGDQVANELRWNLLEAMMYKLDPRASRYLIRQQARQWVAKLGAHNIGVEGDSTWERSLKIPVKNAIRAQVISEHAANLAGDPIQINKGCFAWSKKLQCFVVTNKDWVEVIIPSHGGCDLDDFFLIRFRIVDGVIKAIIVRNPLTRGEYTMWDLQGDDWPKGIDIENVPELSLKRRPKQILEVTTGDKPSVHYLELPSQRLVRENEGQITKVTRNYQRRDLYRSLDNRVNSSGSVGQIINSLLVVLDGSVTWYPKTMPYSEDAVDVFTGADNPQDQSFLMDWAESEVNKRIESQKDVDYFVALRIPEFDELSITHNGTISNLKRVQLEEVEEYNEMTEALVDSLTIPLWLEMLKGNPDAIKEATEVLKKARSKHWKATQDGLNPFVEVGNYLREELAEEETEAKRHAFVMSLWYAMWTVPTRAGVFNDSYLFGPKTGMLQYVLDALVYYGICEKPYVTEDGRIAYYENQNPYVEELGQWKVTCEGGGETHFLSAPQLRYFLSHNRCCSQHSVS